MRAASACRFTPKPVEKLHGALKIQWAHPHSTFFQAKKSSTSLVKLHSSSVAPSPPHQPSPSMMGSGLGSQGGPPRDTMASGFTMEPAKRLSLTAKCKHYTGRHEVPWDSLKYVTG